MSLLTHLATDGLNSVLTVITLAEGALIVRERRKPRDSGLLTTECVDLLLSREHENHEGVTVLDRKWNAPN